MGQSFNVLIDEAIWVAESLFYRNKVSGSSANLSFKFEDDIYITGSGTSFGRLESTSFSKLSLDGKIMNDVKPSKEWPLHQALYRNDEKINAVIHTHSTYSTYWSSQKRSENEKLIPTPTPYLKMKVGDIGFIPYAEPGSEELFNIFRKLIDESKCYLLADHGPILGDVSLIDAFYSIEELEESAKNAWLLKF